MPDVGEGLTEAEILKWYVQPGDTVTDGQVVIEVETAKAAVELPIPFDGTVHELRFPEGTTVDVGEVIISVNVGGGAAPEAEAPVAEAPVAEAAPAAPAAAAPAAATPAGLAAEDDEPKGRQPVLVGYGVAASSTKRRPRKAPAGPAATAVPAAPVLASVPEQLNGHGPVGSRPLAKPPVRKLAKDLGVDLASVTPTGPDGIITREDVHAAAAPAPAPVVEAPAPVAAPAPAPVQAPAPAAAAPVSSDAREIRIPIKGVRKVTAAAMVGSAFTAPHVT
ncbi:biotin/lipoyl-containing protein, partial [Streptomyces sp. NPDC055103]